MVNSPLVAHGATLPPAPLRLLPGRSRERRGWLALPPGRVRQWEVTLKVLPGQDHSLAPSPAGVHSLTSSWLHSNDLDPDGESHHGRHDYWVRWRRSTPDTLGIRLALLRDELSSVLVKRLFLGRAERLGQVALLVTGLREVGSARLEQLVGAPCRRWTLQFPTGVTFKRGDICMPWPSPEAVLNSIRRRLAQVWGWEPDASAMREALRAVAPCRIDLATRSWREGRNGRAREVALAVGEIEWAASGPEETRRLIDLLLQAGELIGVGAKTTWGAGALEVSRPGLATPPEGVATR